MADYEKVGLLVIREKDKAVLLCRKHGLRALILPGGCVEPGETPRECLSREIREELGGVMLGEAQHIGTYEDVAASDDPSAVKTVRIQLYQGDIIGRPAPSAEIAELIWFHPDSDHSVLSPILENKIFKDVVGRGILDWNWR